MPKYAIELKADLENISSVTINPPFILTLTQTGGTEQRAGVEVDPSEEEQEVFGSKGTVHFKLKWEKKDKFEATLKVISPVAALTESDAWTRIVTFETRGLDVLSFTPTLATVQCCSTYVFASADISDYYVEYDEVGACPISLSNLEARVVLL